MDTVAFPGVKWPGREADHSPATSAEVKKMWIYTSNSPYAFMAFKHRNSLAYVDVSSPSPYISIMIFVKETHVLCCPKYSRSMWGLWAQ
jgi:hypothetical protein